MAQQEDLKLLRAVATREQYDEREQTTDDDINERNEHRRPPRTGTPTLTGFQPAGSGRHDRVCAPHALMAAGLVDRVQVTLFPVITGQNGSDPIFHGAADFDLELVESRTLDGNIQELIYRPTLHV